VLQPSAQRSAHVNTRTRVTANIFFIPLSPPSGYRIFVILRIPDFMRRQWRIKQNTTGGSGASGKNLCLHVGRAHLCPPPPSSEAAIDSRTLRVALSGCQGRIDGNTT